jgi:hypothetical protein
MSADSASAYRERLDRKSFLNDREAAPDPETLAPDLAALRDLVHDMDDNTPAFQSVAVAAVQILERALCFERVAAHAALSLGQREKMQSMVETVQDAVRTLRGALSVQGAKVMRLCSETQAAPPTEGQPWWFALTDALEVLEEGTGRMSSLTTAQPEGSPAHALSRCITQLLRGHHDALLLEAEQWIS